MIPRYENSEISAIWSDKNKLRLWLNTETAVIKARANLSLIDRSEAEQTVNKLVAEPIDIDWWLRREKEVSHDLNAFLDERLRFLPIELQPYFHSGMTSYDTEEPAFAAMLSGSVSLLKEKLSFLDDVLKNMAIQYRHTFMNGRTHGQEAELQSFGKRCLTWFAELQVGIDNLKRAAENLAYSKLSGAIGNYRGLGAEVEKEALEILGLKPFYGATQIMPRALYAPLSQAVCQIILTIHKIAIDIRLGARSGHPIYQEPFGKKQKGSSVMPHKKNTISCEQLEGMARAAVGYMNMIMGNIPTWEERSIEQSSVERIAWPDLFHVAIHSVKTITRVLSGLSVYPDNMMKEIIDLHGCYAAGEAKEFLREHGSQYGLSAEDAYRIVQLAAFNAFSPAKTEKKIRDNPPESFVDAEKYLDLLESESDRRAVRDIRLIIRDGSLKVSDQLDADEKTVHQWNGVLNRIFKNIDVSEWNRVFSPSYLLRGEAVLYAKLLGK